jgi:hypothetical protein
VRKNTAICPHCGARLSGIRCRNCGFSGTIADFANDRCPKCGSVVATTTELTCPKCSNVWDGMYCLNCGHRTSWFWLIGGPLISFLFLSLWIAYGVSLVVEGTIRFNTIIELALLGIIPIGLTIKFSKPLVKLIQARWRR